MRNQSKREALKQANKYLGNATVALHRSQESLKGIPSLIGLHNLLGQFLNDTIYVGGRIVELIEIETKLKETK